MLGILLALTFVSSPVQTLDAQPASPRTVENDFSYGNVRIFLPRHLVAGQPISGSVFATPTGGDWADQHQNATYLNSLTVELGNARFKVGDVMFEMTVPSDSQMSEKLIDESGKVLAKSKVDLSVPLSPLSSDLIVMPGNPIGIVGHFEGLRVRTFVDIDKLSAGILAESNDECYVTAPEGRLGPIQLRIDANHGIIYRRVSLVQLTLMAPSKATVSGQPSSIGLEVSGLQDLAPDEFPLVIKMSTDNSEAMQFENGDRKTFRLEIQPSDVVNGNVLKSVPIRALRKGSYHISGNIIPPRLASSV